MASGRPGALRRLADRLGRPRGEIDADTMTAESTEVGAVPIGAVRLRSRATVVGEIRSVTLRPRGDVPALVVELWDGTDALHLVWLGRRTIPGIEPGISLEATGRVTKHRGAITIFNPAYEIVLHGSHHG